MAPVLRSMTKSTLIMPPAPPTTAASTNAPRNATRNASTKASTKASIKASTKASTNVSPDLFSRLPAEVRHIVYSYLNFPVGGYIWIDCPGRWHNSCSHASHFSLYSNGKRSWMRHASNGVFQVRRKIEKLQFSRRYSNLRHIRACLVKTDNDDDDDDDSSDEDDYFESWEENKNWCLAERNILGVNKEIRSELMDLVFGRTEIDFDDVLTLKHSPQGPFALYPRVQWPDTVFWLRLLPSTLAHMTSITIPGKSYVEDYRSLSFIATHAINLRRLTFIWTRYYNNIDMANRLVETLQRVYMIAKKLQTLRFVVKGYKPTRKEQEFKLEKPESGFTESNIRRLVHGIDSRS